MKLIVKTVETPRGPKVMLCDEGGQPLPCQRETVTVCGVDRVDEITVTFVVDRKSVLIAAD
ncbi:hypothetical protein [Phenylobacterium sp.]|uniref:hypothetical protein n=1 Tax=Phenylobacterium sp. TaxID=1871053 RepID=UPI00300179EA